MHILITDDEAHVVERLASTIDWRSIGIHVVYKAYSAEEALTLLQQFSIDIIITDIQMPGMSGLQLIAEIKEKWNKCKCILLTGYSDFQYAKEAIKYQTEDYLIKPVKENELIETVKRSVEKLEKEWGEVISRKKIQKTLKENLPLLRGNLLNELLQGRKMPLSALQEKMAMLEMPDFIGKPSALMLVRLEEPFIGYNFQGLSLIEYAVSNMAEEILGQHFELWHTKDVHEYLVFMVVCKTNVDDNETTLLFERAASQLQNAVGSHLNGEISVLVSGWGTFPADSSSLYHSSISTFRKRIGSGKQLLLRVEEAFVQAEIRSMQSLYEPPSLNHLLDAGRWNSVEVKLHQVFTELTDKCKESQEHLLEAYFHILSAYTYIIHKNGRQLSEAIPGGYAKLQEATPFGSVIQLQEWSIGILQRLKAETDQESRESRDSIINTIQCFIEQNLSHDVSLQAIANHVYMHPVYISKIYKMETGDNLSDYIHYIRMEKAEFLLKNSDEKIFEISTKLGYQRPHSFNYAFKKHYDMTPQEYRARFRNAMLSD